MLFLGWSVWTILIVYWLENGIVGAFNVLKMRKAEGGDDGARGRLVDQRPAGPSMAKAGLVPFFVMHYGIFWFVHGVFVLTLPLFAGAESDRVGHRTRAGPLDDPGRGRGPVHQPRRVVPVQLHRQRRVPAHVSARRRCSRRTAGWSILHVTIIFGAIAISMTGAPVAAIVVLVLLKTALDLGLHLREHRGLAPAKVDLSIG